MIPGDLSSTHFSSIAPDFLFFHLLSISLGIVRNSAHTLYHVSLKLQRLTSLGNTEVTIKK